MKSILSSIAIALLASASWSTQAKAQPNSGSGNIQFACGEKYAPSKGQYFPASELPDYQSEGIAYYALPISEAI